MSRHPQSTALTTVGAVLLALLFLAAGVSKFIGVGPFPDWERLFIDWGYAGFFMEFVGILEICGAVLLLVPRVRLFGALLLALIMAGAVVTHLGAAQISLAAMAGALALLCLSVGVGTQWLITTDAEEHGHATP